MSLTLADVQDLFRRAQLSVQRGYEIARGDHYATELGGSDGSPAGLVALCQAALASNREEVAPPETVEVPTWTPSASAPEAIAEPIAEPEPAVDPVVGTEAEVPAPEPVEPDPALEGEDEDPLIGEDESLPNIGSNIGPGDAPKKPSKGSGRKNKHR